MDTCNHQHQEKLKLQVRGGSDMGDSCHPSAQKQGKKNQELKLSLTCIVSAKPAWATRQDPVSKSNQGAANSVPTCYQPSFENVTCPSLVISPADLSSYRASVVSFTHAVFSTTFLMSPTSHFSVFSRHTASRQSVSCSSLQALSLIQTSYWQHWKALTDIKDNSRDSNLKYVEFRLLIKRLKSLSVGFSVQPGQTYCPEQQRPNPCAQPSALSTHFPKSSQLH